MPLKYKCKTKEEIPAEHRPLYAEREGGWLLDVDGAVDKSKLDEFRTTNVSLLKERDDLKKRYEGIDPDEVRKLADEKRRLEEEKLLNGTPHPGHLPSMCLTWWNSSRCDESCRIQRHAVFAVRHRHRTRSAR